MAGSPDDGGGAGAGRVLVAGRAAAALRRTPGLGGSRVPSAKRFEGLVDDVAPTDPLVAGVGHQEVSKVGRAALVVLQQKAKATDDVTSVVVAEVLRLSQPRLTDLFDNSLLSTGLVWKGSTKP